jgi:hypothetical protein
MVDGKITIVEVSGKKGYRPGVDACGRLQYCKGEQVIGTVIITEPSVVNEPMIRYSAEAHVEDGWDNCVVIDNSDNGSNIVGVYDRATGFKNGN